MDPQQLSLVLDKAREVCTGSGGRLTEKRKRVLELLLEANKLLSAYEIKDAYNATFPDSIPTISVYRIMDFLEAGDLVHKLSSTKKYIACAHIASDKAHDAVLFLVCGECDGAREVAVPRDFIDELSPLVDTAGYTLRNSQLELQCVCRHCLETASE